MCLFRHFSYFSLHSLPYYYRSLFPLSASRYSVGLPMTNSHVFNCKAFFLSLTDRLTHLLIVV